jgi:hypothetical protein
MMPAVTRQVSQDAPTHREDPRRHFHGTSCDCSPCFPSTRRQILLTAASALLPKFALAQKRLLFDPKASCSFYPGDEISEPFYEFGSSQEALDIVKRITSSVGLEPNFELLQANIPNAAAVIYEQKRYILYSLLFIQQIDAATATAWAAWTILAHEIGHHLNGHTLSANGSRPGLELQADRFAGHAVKRMGGSLDQAFAAYQIMPAVGTDTHPPRSARLEAVTKGWTEASGLAADATSETAPKDSDALAKEIMESLRSGSPPYSRMSQNLLTDVNGQSDPGLAKLKSIGPTATLNQQGKHHSTDGTLYYLYDVKNGAGNLSCLIGLTEGGILNVLHCQ